jgi:hypothetical protein
MSKGSFAACAYRRGVCPDPSPTTALDPDHLPADGSHHGDRPQCVELSLGALVLIIHIVSPFIR